ncbi:MAG: DUF480 domain-containing protein [Xanthomonadaceae bacterium]|nr:DUF480 domain-containing protein [Xanthomonadaceae bacterium]
MTQLTPTETRILGCLIEKQATTPDVYPLTLNALVTACNQKTSRDPVMNLSPGEVGHTLRDMAERELVRLVPGGRADRWEHRADKALDLTKPQRILIGLLFLRGPQTSPELLGRSERMHKFENTAEVQEEIERLRGRGYVTQLARHGGQRETRYGHLFSGEPNMQPLAPRAVARESEREPVREPLAQQPNLETRIADLEARVAALESKSQ